MLIPCVSCGKREYTEESPLWHYCDKCLKINYCEFCGHETNNKILCNACIRRKEVASHYLDSMRYCDGCGEDYPNAHLTYVDVWDGYFCDRCSVMEEVAE